MVNKYIKTRENINKVIPAKIYIPKAKETGYRLFPCHSRLKKKKIRKINKKKIYSLKSFGKCINTF